MEIPGDVWFATVTGMILMLTALMFTTSGFLALVLKWRRLRKQKFIVTKSGMYTFTPKESQK